MSLRELSSRNSEGSVGGLSRIEDKALIRYKCGRCGAEFSALDLEYMPSIKCPFCGYRVIYKVRPPGSKLVRAI